MYYRNLTQPVLFVSQLVVLLGTVLTNPAASQGLNFVDLNQSRQFFSEGRRNIDREIEILHRGIQVPKIKLPEDYQKPEKLEKSNFLYQHKKIQSMTNGMDKSY